MRFRQTIFLLLPAGFLLLGCSGMIFPTGLTWGFHFFGFLPGTFFITAACITAAVSYLLFPRSGRETLPEFADAVARREPYYAFAVAGVLLLVSLSLRVTVPLLGDGFFLVKNFSDAFHGSAPVYYRNEPLATAYFWHYYQIAGVPTTFREFLSKVLSAELFLEAAFLFLSYRIIRELSDRPLVRMAGVSLVAAMPYMQLFFGYVEIYAVVLFAFSLYLLAALLSLRGKIPFWVAVFAYLFLCLTHYLAVIILPSLLYLGYTEYRQRGWKDVIIGAGAAAFILGSLLVAIGFDVDQFTEYVPYHHYLSLTPRSFTPDAETDPYTLLSPRHFADLANYFLLMGGGFLFLLWAGITRGRLWRGPLSEIQKFLFMALLPVTAVLIVIKFDLGAARDWDVFSSFFLLLPLLIVTVLNDNISSGSLRLTALAVVILLLHSGSFWVVNSRTDATLARTVSFLDKNAISAGAYYNTSLSLAQYYHQINQDAGAISVWQNYCVDYPLDPRGYKNLLVNFNKQTPPPVRAIGRVLLGWYRALPSDSAAVTTYRNYCIDRGNDFFQRGVNDSAAVFYEQAVAADSTYPVAYNNLGSILAVRGDTMNARKYFLTAIRLNPSYGDAMYNLAMLLEDRGDPSAETYYRKAASVNNEAAKKKLAQPRRTAVKSPTR